MIKNVFLVVVLLFVWLGAAWAQPFGMMTNSYYPGPSTQPFYANTYWNVYGWAYNVYYNWDSYFSMPGPSSWNSWGGWPTRVI
jgi:hypothetical protein